MSAGDVLFRSAVLGSDGGESLPGTPRVGMNAGRGGSRSREPLVGLGRHARSRIPIRGAITELSCRATSRLIAKYVLIRQVSAASAYRP